MVKKLITEAGFYDGVFRPAGQMYEDGEAGQDDASDSGDLQISAADKRAAAKKLTVAEKAVNAAQAKVEAADDDAAKAVATAELTAAQSALADLKA